MYFPDLPDTSRVWIYTADRTIDQQEQELIQAKLDAFIPEWTAHGAKISGDAGVIENYFVVLVVDESKAGASGCSIDTSTRFIKDLGSQLNVDFFDRLYMIVKENGENKRMHISELSNHPDAEVFNPMVSTLGELRNNWLVEVKSSPFV